MFIVYCDSQESIMVTFISYNQFTSAIDWFIGTFGLYLDLWSFVRKLIKYNINLLVNIVIIKRIVISLILNYSYHYILLFTKYRTSHNVKYENMSIKKLKKLLSRLAYEAYII